MAKTIFLSYSRVDAAAVSGLEQDIESLGHQAWVDRELSGGQKWWQHILERIRECDAFVFAVSAASADSQACQRELAYAELLGKPILPVTVEPNFVESLLPRSLSHLQRVNYSAQDKAAFAALVKGLGELQPPPPLPAELPEDPPVPGSYLFDLKDQIDSSGPMSAERQRELVEELRSRISTGHDQQDLKQLVDRFRKRDDILKRTDESLGELSERLRSASTKHAQTQMPPPARERAAYSPPPPEPRVGANGEAKGKASGLWWLALIPGGIPAGLIAYIRYKDFDPGNAKKLLIASPVAQFLITNELWGLLRDLFEYGW